MNKEDHYLKLHIKYDEERERRRERESKQTVEHDKKTNTRDSYNSVCDMKVMQNKKRYNNVRE